MVCVGRGGGGKHHYLEFKFFMCMLELGAECVKVGVLGSKGNFLVCKTNNFIFMTHALCVLSPSISCPRITLPTSSTLHPLTELHRYHRLSVLERPCKGLDVPESDWLTGIMMWSCHIILYFPIP